MKGPVPRPKGRTGHRIDVGRFSLRDVGVLVGGLNGVLDGLVRIVVRCCVLRRLGDLVHGFSDGIRGSLGRVGRVDQLGWLGWLGWLCLLYTSRCV